MTALALVDSPPAAAAARRDHSHAIVATDNPMLALAMEHDDRVENIDRLMPQDVALRIGGRALELTNHLETLVSSDDITAHFGLPHGKIGVTGPASRLVASLLYRAAMMARALKAHSPDRIVLRLVDQPRWEPTQPLMLPRFAHPARALAELGFFGACPVDMATVAFDLPSVINDTAVRDWGRRLAMLPWALLAYEFMSRFKLAGRSRNVVVGQENDALRESLPWLWLSGVGTRRAGSVITRPSRMAMGFADKVEADPLLKAALNDVIASGIGAVGEFDAGQTRALADLIAIHLSYGLRHLAMRLPEQKRKIDALFPNDGGMLLTNGLFGPAGMMVHRLCEARRVAVYEFEHGVTAGLAALTDTKLEHAGPPPVNVLMACSARAALAFNGEDAGPAVPVGLPDQVRLLLRRPLQRWLARRQLGLGREAVVMHVSTLPYFGNHRPGLGAPTETRTFALDRALIEQVYPAVPHRVVFKQYPTQRFPYEPNYQDLFSISPNLMFRKDEDFRYIRAAADVIVTMTPTSTLGWCIGTGVPIVWLDSRLINPLSSEGLRDEFRASFLFVDLDQPDWETRLLGLLNRPLGQIRDDWASRHAARDRLCRESIAGPPGCTGRLAAAAILADMRCAQRSQQAAGSGVQTRMSNAVGSK